MILRIPHLFICCIFCFCTSASAQDNAFETILQTGHYGPITSVDFSPNGRLIVTASEDNTLKLWEVESGRALRTFVGHDKSVRSVDFNPNGKEILSVGYDQTAKVWDIETGEVKFTLQDSADQIRSAIFSPKGTYILTGGHETNATLWEASTGKFIRKYQTKPSVCYQCASSLVFSAEEDFFYTSSGDYTGVKWDINSGDTIAIQKFSKNQCSSCNTHLAIHPSGKKMAQADYGDGLYLVDVKSGKKIKQLAEDEDFYAIQFDTTGQYLLGLVNYSGKAKVWEVKTGEVILEIEAKKGLNALRFSPDGKFILTGGENEKAQLWSLANGSLVRTFEGVVSKIEEEGLNRSELYYINLLKDTQLSPDGKLVAQCKRGNEVVLWDFYTGRLVKSLKGHASIVTCVSFSPDGKKLATGSVDRNIKIWDVATGRLLKTIDAHSSMLLSVQFSADGKYVISGSWDRLFAVWEVASGKRISTAGVHEGSPYSVNMTPNNLYALTGGLDQTLKLTELDSRDVVRSYTGHTDVVQSIAIDPTGEKMLSASWDGSARIWDLRTGWQELKFSGHKGKVYCASYDPTGQKVVTGGEDKSAKVWDAQTGELQYSFDGHTGGVNYAEITPNGRYLITASRDHSVKIWDLDTKRELVTHFSMEGKEWVAKTPDGSFEGTDKAIKTLFFVRGTKSYALDQFFEQFYRPGTFKKALSENTSNANDRDLLFTLEQAPPPTIEILSPVQGTTTAKSNNVEVIVKVTNNGGGIDEIKILHNKKRLNLAGQLSRTPKEGQDMVQTYSIQLLPGDNQVSISAFSKSRIESRPQIINLYYEGTSVSSNLYLLAIGINQYKNPALSLNYARADAEAFAKTLTASGEKMFKSVNVTLLTDQEATKSNILSELNLLVQKVKKEDVFYFYYAGHGGIHNGEFFFIPTESVSLYQADKLKQEAISASALNEKIKQIPALKQVILMDACHAGASTQILASRGVVAEKALAQLARSAGIHIMAAAGSEQQAVEFGKLGHGVFTHVLLEGLKGMADGAPDDQKVTVYELKSYLDDQVPEVSKKYQGKVQYPNTFSLGQDFPMVIAE